MLMVNESMASMTVKKTRLTVSSLLNVCYDGENRNLY